MMKLVVFFLVCLFCFVAKGQSLSNEFARMYNHLDSLDNYLFNVEYTVIGSSLQESDSESDVGAVSVLVCDQGYFYKAGFAEIIVNKENTLVVIDEEKLIYYADHDLVEQKKELKNLSVLASLDSLINKADSVYFQFDGLERVYFLRLPKQYFSLIELHFKSNYLSEIVYYYNDEIVEEQGLKAINKIHIEENVPFNKDVLLTSYYFSNSPSGKQLTSTFEGYRLEYNESTLDYLK